MTPLHNDESSNHASTLSNIRIITSENGKLKFSKQAKSEKRKTPFYWSLYHWNQAYHAAV